MSSRCLWKWLAVSLFILAVPRAEFNVPYAIEQLTKGLNEGLNLSIKVYDFSHRLSIGLVTAFNNNACCNEQVTSCEA